MLYWDQIKSNLVLSENWQIFQKYFQWNDIHSQKQCQIIGSFGESA